MTHFKELIEGQIDAIDKLAAELFKVKNKDSDIYKRIHKLMMTKDVKKAEEGLKLVKKFKSSLNEDSLEESTKAIAETIFKQLGGQGRLKAMIAAKDFTYDSKDGSVGFKFKKSQGINYIKIRLNGNDLYNIEYGNIVKFNYKVVSTETDVYADTLKHNIEQKIKQYLSL